MKTKEEILEQLNFFIAPHKKEQILDVMEEYASQFNLNKENINLLIKGINENFETYAYLPDLEKYIKNLLNK